MDMFWLFCIVAVLSGWVKQVMRSRERLELMRIKNPQAAVTVYETYAAGAQGNSRQVRDTLAQRDAQIASLCQEMSQLRDTTTQYCVSLQHTLERLERRVEFLESQTNASASAGVGFAPGGSTYKTTGQTFQQSAGVRFGE